jgi:hypothetical protein
MNKKLILSFFVLFCLLVFPLQAVGLAAPQVQDGPLATLTVTDAGLVWQPLVEAAGWKLRISGLQGVVFEASFEAEAQPVFALKDAAGNPLPDGTYTYDLWGISPAKELAGPLYMSGTFTILDKTVLLPDNRQADPPQAPMAPNDDVIADDLIVQGRACIGEGGCTDGMFFTYQPLILRQDVMRLYFDDTSTFMGAEPYRDWVFLINDGAAGGSEYFAIQDFGIPSSVPFKIMGGALNNSLFVASSGNIGLGTATPETNLHITSASLPPGIRLEQVSTAQEWGISADSAGFYVWDATNAVTPFTIEANSPYASLYVDTTGNVGIGTNAPATRLQVNGDIRVQDTIMPSLLLYQFGGADPAQMWSINASHNSILFRDGSHGGNQPFVVETASPSNSLYVDSTGNVGIGTDAPAARLHVNGGLRADGFTVEAGTPVQTLYVDSAGRVGIGTASPSSKLHVMGNMYASGSLILDGFVNERSDVASKTAFAAVDNRGVLERLSSVPITTWSYKDSPEVRHMGPTAQDFRAAYGLGPDEKHLAALDTNGVALAAIQALDAKATGLEAKATQLEAQVKEKDARIQTLQSQVDELRERMQTLEGGSAPRGAAWLWGQLAPLALGLLGLIIGMHMRRKR